MDKELGAQRKARWETAFSGTSVDHLNTNSSRHDLAFDDDGQEEKHQRDINRKATIVLEHLIQVWLMMVPQKVVVVMFSTNKLNLVAILGFGCGAYNATLACLPQMGKIRLRHVQSTKLELESLTNRPCFLRMNACLRRCTLRTKLVDQQQTLLLGGIRAR
jgi:hypothetical protein